ncbi:hypothetical protein NQ315_017084 [Exocentrus adspersus]|uniref:Uncharacterized protein n=1 Tax=Exocentrus adspersus TaxID=1586481 RepID=A0AAV8VH59_9CUCU|nr:hypothetical protein NQ315_017084 [Exocentrus adspersus]
MSENAGVAALPRRHGAESKFHGVVARPVCAKNTTPEERPDGVATPGPARPPVTSRTFMEFYESSLNVLINLEAVV